MRTQERSFRRVWTALGVACMAPAIATAGEVIEVVPGDDLNAATALACARGSEANPVTVEFAPGEYPLAYPLLLGTVAGTFEERPCSHVTLTGSEAVLVDEYFFPAPAIAIGPAPWQPLLGTLHHLAVEGLTVEAGFSAMGATGVQHLRVEGNHFAGTGTALLRLGSTPGVVVSGNNFSGAFNNHLVLFQTPDAVASDNAFTLAGDFAHGIWAIDSPDAQILDNRFTGSGTAHALVESIRSGGMMARDNDLSAFSGSFSGAAIWTLDAAHCTVADNDLRNQEHALLLWDTQSSTFTDNLTDPGARVTIDAISTDNAFELTEHTIVCNEGGATNTFEGSVEAAAGCPAL